MKKEYLYEGIRVRAEEGLFDLLQEDGVEGLIQHFFSHEAPDTIEWVSQEVMNSPEDVELPMYSVSNGKIEVTFWPVIDTDGSKLMLLKLQSFMGMNL
jgi:hypothetical protein